MHNGKASLPGKELNYFPVLCKDSQVGTHTGEGNNEPQLMNYTKLLPQSCLFVFTVFCSVESRTSN